MSTILNVGTDDIACCCGNMITYDGFVTADPVSGKYVSPDIGGTWDEETIICIRCGLLFHQETGVIVPGSVSNPKYDYVKENPDGYDR